LHTEDGEPMKEKRNKNNTLSEFQSILI